LSWKSDEGATLLLGTALFADVWCVPAASLRRPGGVSPLVPQWLDFTTQPAR
jgi:hypothetical protein